MEKIYMIIQDEFSSLPIFKDLSEDELKQVLQCGKEFSVPGKQMILEESSVSQDLYVILGGRVSVEIDVVLQNEINREQMVIIREGDVFGEIAFLKKKRRSAYVISVDDVRVLKLNAGQLSEVFEQNNHIGYVMMRNLAVISSQRLIETNFRWRNDIRHIF